MDILANDNSILSEWDGKSTKSLRTEHMKQVILLSVSDRFVADLILSRQLKEKTDRMGQKVVKDFC